MSRSPPARPADAAAGRRSRPDGPGGEANAGRGRAAGTAGPPVAERESCSRFWSASACAGRGAEGVGAVAGTGAGSRRVSGATTASSSAAAAAQVHVGSRRVRAGAIDAAPSRATTREGKVSK